MATLTITYEAALSRVKLSAVDIDSSAEYAVFERGRNGTGWETVRGGVRVPISAGGAEVYDYEFVPDVENDYRVVAFDETTSSFVSVGTGSNGSGSNPLLTPGMPAGRRSGDLLVALTAVRNTLGGGSPNVPEGWATLRSAGHVKLLGKLCESASESAPTFSYVGASTGGVATVQIACFRNVGPLSLGGASATAASAQNIAVPGSGVADIPRVDLWAGWKGDDWSSSAPPAGTIEISEYTTTTGDDAGHTWSYRLTEAVATIPASQFTISGGVSAPTAGLVISLPHQITEVDSDSDSITPEIDRPWIKSITNPNLNRKVTVMDYGPISRQSRGGVFPIISRSLPIAVTDLRLGKEFELLVVTHSTSDANNLEYLMALGDVVFIQVPSDCDVPSGYFFVTSLNESRTSRKGSRRVWSMSMVEVAKPAADVVGSTVTWQAIIDDFDTWADVITEFPTWADVLNYVASPESLIVP